MAADTTHRLHPLADVVAHPSGWDSPANYVGQREFPGWYVVLTRTRDSGCLAESNWRSALRVLGGEVAGQLVIHRFGHWACGWWEALAVHETAPQWPAAVDLATQLADYPVVDDDDLSALEQEAADDTWRTCYDWRERLRYIRQHRSQFEFHGLADLLGCVRGRYFAGYASELID